MKDPMQGAHRPILKISLLSLTERREDHAHSCRAKTDRLDAIRLVINLRAWLRGERDRMHVVHVPSAQDEASRHLMRERGQLQKEVLQHLDRMRKLLATLGCWEDVAHRPFAERLARDECQRRA
ncbi:hypothetical protein PPGU19_095150 (plasmid) [Paraburkholderia sp. PGU19]|nr:hypothetical protein PPGU19_095150 [Paraburkholderia sp. PGU19]